jgi:hypothetical protein
MAEYPDRKFLADDLGPAITSSTMRDFAESQARALLAAWESKLGQNLHALANLRLAQRMVGSLGPLIDSFDDFVRCRKAMAF